MPMIGIAFMNAMLRQLVFTRYMNELRAHQLSTITLIIFCSVYVRLIFPYLHIQNLKQVFSAGLLWVVLTVLFEFSFGRLNRRSWPDLLQDYNIIAGRIWPVFLLSLFLLPWLIFISRK